MSELKVVKLITEEADSVTISLVEAVQSPGTKDLYIEGIFSTHTAENRNGRKYKKELLEREVSKLLPEINSKRLYGELSHPQNPEVNLERAAILIEKLSWNGTNLNGKALVLETPMGDIVRGCCKKGMVGVSSRGLGTVSEDGWVNEDYQMITYDVVSQPSNAPSWVKGICESKNYYINESGVIVKSESIIPVNEKTDVINDALKEMQTTIEEMVNATIEAKFAHLKENKLPENTLDEKEAIKLYTNTLKESLKQTLSALV